MRLLAFLFVLIAVASAACHRQAEPKSENVLAWQPVGTWSGTADLQTESFTSQTGTFKFTWDTKNTTAKPGHVLITLHSAVSGRPLVQAVDHEGDGMGEIYVNEDPREFYVVVAATDISWNLKVDEGISLILTPKTR